MLDTSDEWNPRNPINEKKSDLEPEETDLERIESLQHKLKYKIRQLRKLAEIENDLNTFGTITYEQQKEKIEILNQYR